MANTTTTLNTRLFAPQVILAQDTTRLAIKLKSGEGYTIPSGLTLGDVIRYDPNSTGYTLSIANSEINAEVLGVIESISSGEYTVICSGSIKYPSSRLGSIVSGGGGGIDILFLDEAIAGGLTGTIDQSTGAEKIVKPVIQIAPHAAYNGVVMNYVGYKTGNQAVSQEDSPLLPVGSIMYSVPNITPGINWIRIDSSVRISTTDYSELFAIYSTTYGPYVEKLTITDGYDPATFNTGLIGKRIYYDGDVVRATIIDVDSSNKQLFVLVAGGEAQSTVYLNAGPLFADVEDVGFLTVVSSVVYEFTIPAVSDDVNITQASITLVPFIKAYEFVSIKIPDTISLVGITASGQISTTGNVVVGGNLQVGSLTDIEAEILALKTAVFP